MAANPFRPSTAFPLLLCTLFFAFYPCLSLSLDISTEFWKGQRSYS